MEADYYIHPDHLNTPQKMTDSGQAIVYSAGKQIFGEAASSIYSMSPATLSSVGFNGNQQFQFTVTGISDYNYAVQAATDLSASNWVTLATNTSPFTFTDSNRLPSRTRFYRAVYRPPPSSTGTVPTNLRFPGQYADVESGLNYNLMRDYDPTLGRYIEGDPIGLAGGLNVYGYAGGNPIGAVDQTGLVFGFDSGEYKDQAIYNGYLEIVEDSDQPGWARTAAFVGADFSLWWRPGYSDITVTAFASEFRGLPGALIRGIRWTRGMTRAFYDARIAAQKIGLDAERSAKPPTPPKEPFDPKKVPPRDLLPQLEPGTVTDTESLSDGNTGQLNSGKPSIPYRLNSNQQPPNSFPFPKPDDYKE